MAEPCVRTIRALSRINIIIIGASHQFFRNRMKAHNSLNMDKLLMIDFLLKLSFEVFFYRLNGFYIIPIGFRVFIDFFSQKITF